MTTRTTSTEPTLSVWTGKYKKNWNSIITSESFSHPAKFARGLLETIVEHALEEGWVKPGDQYIDPFGGIATGAYACITRGLHWTGVELEEHFHNLGQGCDCTGITAADYVRFYARWQRMRYAEGRYWCPRCLAQVAQVSGERRPAQRTFRTQPRPGQKGTQRTVAFLALPLPDRRDGWRPPRTQALFAQETASYARNSGIIPHTQAHHYQGNIEVWAAKGYTGATLLRGDSRRLTEVLTEAGLSISSPPYNSQTVHDSEQEGLRYRRTGPNGYCWGTKADGHFEAEAYSHNPNNLGNMKAGSLDTTISSPPYADGCTHIGGADPHPQHIAGGPLRYVQYGADCSVSSPVYAEALQEQRPGRGPGQTSRHHPSKHGERYTNAGASSPPAYGSSNGQLGTMPPGDVAAVVQGEKKDRQNEEKDSKNNEIDLAYQQNPDRILCSVHNTLSGDSVWQSVKTAGLPYHQNPAGANPVANLTLAQPSRDGQNLQGTAPGSQPPSTTSPCPIAGENRILTGKEEMTAGEGMLGASSGARPLLETTTPASDAGQRLASKSTTRKTQKQRAESGTTASTISKPSASDVISASIEPNLTNESVSSAVQPTLVRGLQDVVLLPANERHSEEQLNDSTAKLPKCTCAKNVAALSLEKDATFVAQKNASPSGPSASSVSTYQSGKPTESQRPSTFWEAAFEVVSQTYAILKPGAHAIWVCKRYVRDGQIVEFSHDWARLCVACGFEVVHWHKAMLVDHYGVQGTLAGGTDHVTVEKKSFFRKLSEKKGSPKIDWEDVICMVRPLTAVPMPPDEAWQQVPLLADLCTSSPAYADSWHSAESTEKNEDRMRKAGYSEAYIAQQFRASKAGGGNLNATNYGQTNGQLGAMPVGRLDCALSSPPYGNENIADARHLHFDERRKQQSIAHKQAHGIPEGYGLTPGNLGNLPEGQKP